MHRSYREELLEGGRGDFTPMKFARCWTPTAERSLPLTAMRAREAGRALGVVGVLVLAPGVALADEPAPPAAPVQQQGVPFHVAEPSKAHGATIARVIAPSFARRFVGSTKRSRRVEASTSWSHQAQVLLVLAATTRDGRDWVKVRLGDRPNTAAGWIPRDNARLGHTAYWVEVRRGARRVTVYRKGKRVRTFKAVIGKPSTPTPLGLGAIYERNRQPNPRAFLGPWSLSLTSHSNVLESYGGGPGRVAIHGRAGASLRDPLGSARSHGCIRVNNSNIGWMAKHVPPGTPVRIRR
jgi:lipoprotein-anchoring transpeptidase ErfK/SrfK